MSRVSINLVTWNGGRYIEDCLRSVFNQSYKDFSLIIIDNGSTDNTLELINERYPHLPIVKQKNNIGFARAHNLAIHWSKSEYVVCLNQDIVLEPDFLLKMVEFMDAHPLAGSATGKIYRLQEGEKTKYIDSLGLNIYQNFQVVDRETGAMDEGQFDSSEEIFGISGALPMYRKKALEEIVYQNQYFDEDFFSYKEDVDLAFRLRLSGWTAYCVPQAIVYHERGVGAAKERMKSRDIWRGRRYRSKFANYYSYRNHLFFLYKSFPKAKWFVYVRIVWYELIKLFYCLFFETRNLRAWSEFFHYRGKLKAKRILNIKNMKVSWEDITKWLK